VLGRELGRNCRGTADHLFKKGKFLIQVHSYPVVRSTAPRQHHVSKQFTLVQPDIGGVKEDNTRKQKDATVFAVIRIKGAE